MDAMTLMVAYKSWKWDVQAATSYLKFVGNNLIVVNNNDRSDMFNYGFFRKNNITVIENTSSEKKHGNGVDIGIDFLKNNNKTHMVLIEPDCIISGSKWYNDIIENLQKGFSLVGKHTNVWNLIHPCITGWKIEDIKYSFIPCLRGEDVFKMHFNQDLARQIQSRMKDSRWLFFEVFFWDTGTKNSFHLMRNQKIVPCPDIVHTGGGSWYSGYRKLPNTILL